MSLTIKLESLPGRKSNKWSNPGNSNFQQRKKFIEPFQLLLKEKKYDKRYDLIDITVDDEERDDTRTFQFP